MSTDIDVVCYKCKKYVHLGQRFAGSSGFGYGVLDYKGRQRAMDFIVDHLECDITELRVMCTVYTPEDYEEC